jgi:hypothetical protein
MYDFDRPRFDAYAGACHLMMDRPAEGRSLTDRVVDHRRPAASV